MVLAARRTEPVTLLQRERALRPDIMLILSYLALTGLGLVMIYSASAPRLLANGDSPTSLVRRQMVFALVGIGAFILTSLIEHRTLKMLAPIGYIGSLVSLVIVLKMPIVAGANRWIDFGFFQFQPSELAKVALILALAALLAAAREGPSLDGDWPFGGAGCGACIPHLQTTRSGHHAGVWFRRRRDGVQRGEHVAPVRISDHRSSGRFSESVQSWSHSAVPAGQNHGLPGFDC